MFKTHSSSKATLFNNLDGLSVAYINHEGIELPLKSVKDFDEAIKSAKWKGRDHLDLIFYDDRLNRNEVNSFNNNKSAIIGRFSKKQTISIPSKSSTNNCCHCNGDALPEWFKQYMKKFKKELLKDLKSSITDIVHEEFEKEKKLTETKQFKPFSDKNEFQSPAKLKKKKKISDKDTIDLLEKREMKLLKKIEKLHSAKFDKLIYPVLYLEKLENKARTLLEERRKLLERGRQNKSRDVKRTWEPERKQMKMEKSILFNEDSALVTVQPGEEFAVSINILNNGTVPWISPRLECRDKPELYLKEHLINLPKLEAGQSINVTIRGRVTKRVGSHHFAYKLFDGLEESDFVYKCFVVVSESKEEIAINSKGSIEGDFSQSEGLVGSLIDFEKDVIANSQKKIKENIIEIEKRLQDFDLLIPCTSGEESREARLNDNGGEFEVAGCDLQSKEKNSWRNRLEQELLFKADLLKDSEETEKINLKDSSIGSENFQTNKSGMESDSDSELSVIFMSEEDENFIVVPPVPESSYPEGLLTSTKPSTFLRMMQCTKGDERENEGIVEEHPVKVELSDEIESEGVSTAEDCLPKQSANTKLIDETERLKQTKSLFEADFAFGNVTSEGVTSDFFENVSFRNVGASNGNTNFNAESNGSPVLLHSKEDTSRNTKPDEKRNHDQNSFNFVFFHNQAFPFQQKKRKNSIRKDKSIKVVPLADTLGRPIYAVRIDGYCLPVKDLIDSRSRVDVPDSESAGPQETQNGENEEASANNKPNGIEIPTVNIIPNVLVNGASSVASMAFNTAKSVINNLQSALKPETGFTTRNVKKYSRDEDLLNSFPYNLYSMGPEERRYVENLANQEKYFDAMITLHEMGFVNNELNFRLLKKYDNEVTGVVIEILDMMATPGEY